jgi:predicted ester cyclase
MAGIPPTGKAVTVPAIQTFRLVDGKIAEAWLSIDRLGMLQQLGVLPAPERAGA